MNDTIHKVEGEWHFEIMSRYGFVPETKEQTGFVRRYVYNHSDGRKMVVCTGAHGDWWEGAGGYGWWGTLEKHLKGA